MPNPLDFVSYLCKDSHSPYCQSLEYEVLVFVVYNDDVNIEFCHFSVMAVFQHIEASHLIFCCNILHFMRKF